MGIIICLSFSFNSCEELLGYDFTKQESVDKIKETIIENLPTDATVSKISFMTGSGDSFSNKMEIITINYYQPESSQLKKMVIYTGENRVVDKTSSIVNFDKKHKPGNAVKPSDLDLSHIASNIGKAARNIEAEDYAFSGLGVYTIIPNTDRNKTVHEFSIQSRLDSKTKLKGGKMVTETEYYDIPFVADGEGNISAKEK